MANFDFSHVKIKEAEEPPKSKKYEKMLEAHDHIRKACVLLTLAIMDDNMTTDDLLKIKPIADKLTEAYELSTDRLPLYLTGAD